MENHNILKDNLIFKINNCISVLNRYKPFNGYHLAFSGGKDSIVCKKILELSHVKYNSYYSICTVDNPVILPFIRKNYPDVIFLRPKTSMFKLIAEKGILPTRLTRYCCSYLKEYSGKNETVILGIRKEESKERSKRMLFEIDRNIKNNKAFINIIIDFTETEIWEIINFYKLPVPDYYFESCFHSRIGCIGCPCSSNQIKDFIAYPKFHSAYLKAIRKAIQNGHFNNFIDEYDVFNWWISQKSIKHYKSLIKLNF